MAFACGGPVVDTGKPFDLKVQTDPVAPADGALVGELPPDPTLSTAAVPSKTEVETEVAEVAVEVATVEGGTEAVGAATDAVADAETDVKTAATGGSSTSDGDGGRNLDRGGSAGTDETAASDGSTTMDRGGSGTADAGTADEASPPADEADAEPVFTGPGQLLILVNGGVMVSIDGRPMQFVAMEGGYLAARVSAGRHKVIIKNMMGNVVLERNVQIPAGQRLKMRYAKKELSRLGIVNKR